MKFKLLSLAYLLYEWVTSFTHPIRLGVRLILLQDDQVLLVRHTYMSGWFFPGGGLKRFETPVQAATREAVEEAGAELLEQPKLVEITTHFSRHKSDHVAIYICRNFRLREATDRWEIAERKFFAVNKLPPCFALQWRKLLQELASN